MSVFNPDAESMATVREAGLVWVSDLFPGIRRRRRGQGFAYLDPAGQTIDDDETLDRLRKLAIPPAWSEVWISADRRGHIQVTARDARGRKQYRYHARWREVRDGDKYDKMIDFAKALPKLRRTVERDLSRRGLPREKVLATAVRLLETTLIRVGNEEYAKANSSFGLTTLRNRHARVRGDSVRFIFRGKSGKDHEVGIIDRRLARVVKSIQQLPGQVLFQYLDGEGARHAIDSGDVNDYLREAMGEEFTAKDFRTWAGTVLAAQALAEIEAFDSEAQAKKNILKAIETVAMRLGNTRSVCRKCYVHPAVLDAYMDGTVILALQERAEDALKDSLHRLEPEEAAVLAFLQQRLKRQAKAAA